MHVKVGNIFLLGCLAIGLAAGSAAVADNLYFSVNSGANDTLMMVTGLAPTSGPPAGLGDQAGFKAAGTNSDGIVAIDAAMIGGQPRVATGGQFLALWNGNDIGWVAQSPMNPPVRELVLGEVGGNGDRVVIARDTNDDKIEFAMFEGSTLNHVVTPGPHPNLGNASGMARGNFTDNHAGSEIVVSTADLTTLNKTPGYQLYLSGENLGWLGQQPINQPSSDVAAGDLVPGLNNDEAIFTGGIGGDPGPGYGQQSHVFSTGPNVNGQMVYQYENGGGLPHGVPAGNGELLFNAVAVGQLDADPDPEIVLAGNNVIRVLNHDSSFVFQSGPTNANIVDVVIADAMNNDGVNEIIAVTDGGLVFAFGHNVAGDAASGIAGGALGVYNVGNPITGVAALKIIPEPASALLLLLAACGLAVARRR